MSTQNDAAIIGGESVTDQQEFSQTVVSLIDASRGSVCTASLLSDKIALTAAHCVNPSSAMYLVFDRTLTAAVFDPTMGAVAGVRRPVSAAVVSPVWASRQNQPTNTGDIALVRFEGGLPAGFRAASLLTDKNQLTDGMTLTLAGYGISDGVRHTGLGLLRFVDVSLQSANFTASELLMDQTQGRGACHGDSGGPAYARINGQFVVVGVTSRGVNDPNNDCSVNAAYTSVPFYASWIVRVSDTLNQMTIPEAPAAGTTQPPAPPATTRPAAAANVAAASASHSFAINLADLN